MISLKWKLYLAGAFLLALFGGITYARIVQRAVDRERARRNQNSLDAVKEQKNDWKEIRSGSDDALFNELTGRLPRANG